MTQTTFRPTLRRGREVVGQLRQFRIDVGALAAQAVQRGARTFGLTVSGEPAWRLRQPDHAGGEDHAGHAAETQHPAPRAVRGQRVADQIGGEDAQRDCELVAGDERAPRLGRRDLGQIKRRQHRRAADADADQEPSGEQDDEIGSECRDDRTQDEDQRGRQQGRTPSEPVGQSSRDRGAASGTRQGDAGHHTQQQVGEVERGAQEQQRTGDNACVVAEQQPAEGGCPGDDSEVKRSACSPC